MLAMSGFMWCPRKTGFSFLKHFYLVLFPFKISSAYKSGASQEVGQKLKNPEKNHLAHPQAELDLSHMCPVWSSNPHLNVTPYGQFAFITSG